MWLKIFSWFKNSEVIIIFGSALVLATILVIVVCSYQSQITDLNKQLVDAQINAEKEKQVALQAQAVEFDKEKQEWTKALAKLNDDYQKQLEDMAHEDRVHDSREADIHNAVTVDDLQKLERDGCRANNTP